MGCLKILDQYLDNKTTSLDKCSNVGLSEKKSAISKWDSRINLKPTKPVSLIRFSWETSDQWINRCYDHDPRCNGEDLTEYPVLDKGWWVYPYFKAAASEEEIQQHKNRQVNTTVRKSSSIGNNIATATKVNTHKAYCPKCQQDNFIDWYSYPDEKNKKLGCVECQTRIDVHTAYKVGGINE